MSKNRISIKQKQTEKVSSFPFFSIGLIFICISLFLSFFPGVSRGWGLNYIKCFSPFVIVIYYILLLFFLLPPTNGLIIKWTTTFSKKSIISNVKKYRYVLFFIVAIVFSFGFYFLKNKYIILGDCDIRAKQIESGTILNDEYLLMLSYQKIFALINEKNTVSGVQMIQILDYILGGIYIFISLCIADLIGNTFLKKMAVFVSGILSATILMQFCGYAEIYALPLVMLILYILTCLLHLKKSLNIIVPFIILLIGVAFHKILICLAPSYFFLFYRNVLWRYNFFRQKKTFIILVILLIIAFIVAFPKFIMPRLLPFAPGDKGLMTMFSGAHFTEFINSQLLASGILFLIWAAMILYSIIKHIKYDAIQWFLLIASISLIGLSFSYDAWRGSGDWDISAFAAVVYNLNVIYFLLKSHEEKIFNNIKYGIAIIAGISILHTSMWIATNKTDASLEWMEYAIGTDPASYYKNSYNNESMLFSIFSANNFDEKALVWGKKAYLKYKNDPRMGFNYAGMLLKCNQEEKAYEILEETNKKFPYYPMTYKLLLNKYMQTNNINALNGVLNRFMYIYKNNPDLLTQRLSPEDISSIIKLYEQINNLPK